MTRKNQNVAIGGGFVEAAVHPDVVDGDREYGITGLAFCGPNVIANSIIVPPDATTDSDIERVILQVRRRQKITQENIPDYSYQIKNVHFRFGTVEGKTCSHIS